MKSVEAGRASEKVGHIAESHGRIIVVEHHAIETEQERMRVENYPIFSGTSIYSLDFLHRCVSTGVELPYHVVVHREPGSCQETRKVEQFLFDLLQYSRSTGVVLGRRALDYSAIKADTGDDTLATARQALTMRNKLWLDLAGAIGPKLVSRIEISPRYALSAEELARNLPAKFRYRDGLLLEALPPESAVPNP